jgi:leucyl aminopeptidase
MAVQLDIAHLDIAALAAHGQIDFVAAEAQRVMVEAIAWVILNRSR